MKKIISGYFYRALRTAELWIFVTLIIFMSFMNTSADRLEDQKILKSNYDLTTTLDETYMLYDDITPGLYKTEKIGNDIIFKIDVLLESMGYSSFVSLAAIPLFIILFMGKLFTGGALRNLIACGHSKTRVYLASILFGALITIIFNILSMLAMSAGLLIRGYKIPLLLPFLAAIWIYGLLVHLTLLAVSISILFVSERPIVSLIAVTGVVILLFTGSAGVTMRMLLIPERYFSVNAVKAYKEENPDNEIEIEWTFDTRTFQDIYIFKDHGEQLDTDLFLGPKEPHHIEGASRKFLLTGLYANPVCGVLMSLFKITSRYRMWKDGFYTFCCLINAIWITVISYAGCIIFRRKELN